ncbi:MAG TPA: YccF domain-containing protein [Acidimicrobiales bacterium]|nr:YccF domain-containing protein [Acidimicrobiales bacterium]
MKTIGNILWLILVGWHTAISWLVLGLVLCLPIITIPFAVQCFKFAGFTLWPFGRVAVKSTASPGGSLLGNILWFIPGLFLALGYFVGGVILCITIIGIPFGIQSFKFAVLALAPFGRMIVPEREAGYAAGSGALAT